MSKDKIKTQGLNYSAYSVVDHKAQRELWSRNVVDKYKNTLDDLIKEDLKNNSLPAAVMMSQVESDFNFSNVIRTCNFFNLSCVYYYGNKRYDKRGAVGTFNYTDVKFVDTLDQVKELKNYYSFVALENNILRKVENISQFNWKPNSLILIGEEGNGLSDEILNLCDYFVEIENRGSVRSLNAATAAAIAVFDYTSKVGRA